MKNNQKGFVIPIIIAIVALLVVGGGTYIYTRNKVETPVDIISNAQKTTDRVDVSLIYSNEDLGFSISLPMDTGYTLVGFQDTAKSVYVAPSIFRAPFKVGEYSLNESIHTTLEMITNGIYGQFNYSSSDGIRNYGYTKVVPNYHITMNQLSENTEIEKEIRNLYPGCDISSRVEGNQDGVYNYTVLNTYAEGCPGTYVIKYDTKTYRLAHWRYSSQDCTFVNYKENSCADLDSAIVSSFRFLR